MLGKLIMVRCCFNDDMYFYVRSLEVLVPFVIVQPSDYQERENERVLLDSRLSIPWGNRWRDTIQLTIQYRSSD